MENLPTFLKLTVADCLRRFNSGLRGGGRSLEMTTAVREDECNFYLDFRTCDEAATLVIPRARKNEFGNIVLGDRNDRTLCPFMVVVNGQPRHVTYDELVSIFLSCNVEELFPEQGKRNFIDKMMFGFLRKRGRLAVNLCQRFLIAIQTRRLEFYCDLVK